ncbi:hypothetical protein CJ739_1450 [Mariniflexile rhizosphaerae]|uniref:dual OB domain-containing protein n=1 Tax=unclassified Mariniflexile TaxID=2643887 RepID=UPI000CC972B8|nr:hypothetical protein [Mariniflexile sp. TRM1-10]AXP80539.1 hypothetical protein CJ739_1450 [Mariniflexile sp. TRM1-10]PLB20081.1 MAG: hypothetical protein TRG1_1026 [Flavobacteriaceae bacterium FS1-H7996/R]
MEVLVTSKTSWGNSYCIGGLEIATNRFVRLMTTIGSYQPLTAPYQIGQVWDLDYHNNPAAPPHIEDVWIYRNNGLIRNIPNIINYISQNCLVWDGDFNVLFGGLLRWTGNGSGHINNPNNLPNNSVGFWICDRDLTYDGAKYYIYNRGFLQTNKRLPYKGVLPAIPVIPAGTLIRVSLAKWFPSEHVESRCYLQLSGWY